jgi:hypothetical protein
MRNILKSLSDGLRITDYSDWLIFVERLNRAVEDGLVRSVPVLKRVWSDTEQWFLDPKTGETYVYASPNPPSLPKWEKVDVLNHLEQPEPSPLSSFRMGQVTPMTAHIMKMSIDSLIERGLVEELPVRTASFLPEDHTERWYRDIVSNIVYRLREHYGIRDADDIRWELVPRSELSGDLQ